MRLVLLIAVVLAAGCVSRESTVLVAPAAKPVEIDSRGMAWVRPMPLVSPVLGVPRPEAYVLAVKAALAYFHHVDERDAAAGRLVVHDKNGWYGDTDVEIRVQDAGDGRSRVEVSAEGERPRMVLEKYLEHLGSEVDAAAMLRETAAAP